MDSHFGSLESQSVLNLWDKIAKVKPCENQKFFTPLEIFQNYMSKVSFHFSFKVKS
jgi:hypothetical protein